MAQLLEPRLVLRSPKDWYEWIEDIETTATNLYVWDYIDPSLPVQAAQPAAPLGVPSVVPPGVPLPVVQPVVQAAPAVRVHLDLSTFGLEEDTKSQKKLRQNLEKMAEYVKARLGPAGLLIFNRKKLLYPALVALKERYTPDEVEYKSALLNKYRKLRTGPTKGNIDKWIQDFVLQVDRCQETFSIKLLQPQEAERDLFNILSNIDGLFGASYRASYSDWSIETICSKWDSYLETKREFSRVRPTGLAATQPTFQGKDSEGNTIDSNGQGNNQGKRKEGDQKQPPSYKSIEEVLKASPCAIHWRWTPQYGRPVHKTENCRYLRPDLRPSDWKADVKTEERVKELKKQFPGLEKAVKNAKNQKEKSAEKATQQNSDSEFDEADLDYPAANIILPAFDEELLNIPATGNSSTEQQYSVWSSIILDTGASKPITNLTDRVTNFRRVYPYEKVQMGNKLYISIGTAKLTINGTKEGRLRRVTLTVMVVPEAPVTMISFDSLQEVGIEWDTGRNRLYWAKTGKTIIETIRKHRLYFLEYNGPVPARKGVEVEMALAAPISKLAAPTQPEAPILPESANASANTHMLKPTADAKTWHRRFGHPGEDRLEKIVEHYTNVQIKGIPTWQCEPCAQAKAKEVVSYQPTDRAETPFERLQFDRFHLKEALNGFKYADIYRCEATGFTLIKFAIEKHEIVENTMAVINYIKHQFGIKIKKLRADNEIASYKGLMLFLDDESIIIELTPSNTSRLNGGIERTGGVVGTMARAMRIDACLPADLWPWIWDAVVHLLNLTPAAYLGWKSPLEIIRAWLKKKPPTIRHLAAYGCKAYALIKRKSHRPTKKAKLDPRAYIGYLVGYRGTKIFHIWVPAYNEVITTQDVIFDETSFYDPRTEDRSALLERTLRPVLEEIEYKGPLPGDIVESSSESEGESQAEDESNQDEAGSSGGISQPADQIDLGEGRYPTPESQGTSPPPQPVLKPKRVRRLPEPTAASSRELRSGEASGKFRQVVKELAPKPRAKPSEPGPSAETAPGPPAETAPGPPAGTANLAFPVAFHTAIRDATRFHRRFQEAVQLHRRDLPKAPNHWKNLEYHQYGEEFRAAAEAEIKKLKEKDAFRTIARAEAGKQRILPTRWVFTYKLDKKGFLVRFKARLVVRGDQQTWVAADTYAATLAARSLRILMAILAKFNLETVQLDAVNAFANAKRAVPAYIEHPQGFAGPPGSCLLLKRALYGLKESPADWQRELTGTFKELGLIPVPDEPCICRNSWLIAFYWVDDIVLLCRKEDLGRRNALIEQLQAKYELRNEGELQWFLGIRIVRDRSKRRLWLCQDAYIEKIATTFGLTKYRKVATPIQAGYKPGQTQAKMAEPPDQNAVKRYQQRVGSALYAAIITRPDVAFAVSLLARVLIAPSEADQQEIDRVIAYLYQHRYWALLFDGQSDSFIAASDAAFADDLSTRHSSQGHLFLLFGGAIGWRASLQPTTTTSSTEAEILSLSDAVSELIALGRIFDAISLVLAEPLVILCDNQQTIRLVNSVLPRLKTRLRHVDIHGCFVREKAQDGTIVVRWIPTAEMPADGLTKPLQQLQFVRFRGYLGLVDITDLLCDVDD